MPGTIITVPGIGVLVGTAVAVALGVDVATGAIVAVGLATTVGVGVAIGGPTVVAVAKGVDVGMAVVTGCGAIVELLVQTSTFATAKAVCGNEVEALTPAKGASLALVTVTWNERGRYGMVIEYTPRCGPTVVEGCAGRVICAMMGVPLVELRSRTVTTTASVMGVMTDAQLAVAELPSGSLRPAGLSRMRPVMVKGLEVPVSP